MEMILMTTIWTLIKMKSLYLGQDTVSAQEHLTDKAL